MTVDTETSPLTPDELRKMDASWRAANYLIGRANLLEGQPVLRSLFDRDHIKPRLLGHWGTTPGLNFLYVHLNRMISSMASRYIYIDRTGPRRAGMVANTYLEGTYSEVYPHMGQDRKG